jgi:hypothetical protein
MRALISLILTIGLFTATVNAQETGESTPLTLPPLAKPSKKLNQIKLNPILGKWCAKGRFSEDVYSLGESNVLQVESTNFENKKTEITNGTYEYSSFNNVAVLSLKPAPGVVGHNYMIYTNGELRLFGFTRKDVGWKNLEISEVKKLIEKNDSSNIVLKRCAGDLNS